MEISITHIWRFSHVYLSGCSQFKQVETSQNQFLVHMTNRNSMAFHITSALDFNKEGCVIQIWVD